MRDDRAGARRAYSAGDPLPQAAWPLIALLLVPAARTWGRLNWIATGGGGPMVDTAMTRYDGLPRL
jgi:hypothetical protein